MHVVVFSIPPPPPPTPFQLKSLYSPKVVPLVFRGPNAKIRARGANYLIAMSRPILKFKNNCNRSRGSGLAAVEKRGKFLTLFLADAA